MGGAFGDSCHCKPKAKQSRAGRAPLPRLPRCLVRRNDSGASDPGRFAAQDETDVAVLYDFRAEIVFMTERAVTRMSAEEFLEWSLHQELRHELVDGVPVAMAGAKQRHDRIVMNAQGMLYAQLRGKACRNFSADIGVRIPAGNIRRPDAGIDCGAFEGDATTAGAPFLVIEVLSASTREFDMLRKLEEYKTVPSLAHIALVDPDLPQVFHWSRPADENWRYAVLEGLAAAITLPEIDCVLDLASLYEGLTFRSLPRLVREDGTAA